MSDKPETLAAILAEMRAAAKSTDLFNGEEVGEPLIRGTKVEEWADRIEAAAERERNAHTNDIHDALYVATGIPVNAAALREALNRVGHLANDLRNITERDTEVRADVNEIVDVCRAALAAPARNCDRFKDSAEAHIAFQRFCRTNYNAAYAARGLDGCDDCELCETKNMSGEDSCPFHWLFAPAEEVRHA